MKLKEVVVIILFLIFILVILFVATNRVKRIDNGEMILINQNEMNERK